MCRFVKTLRGPLMARTKRLWGLYNLRAVTRPQKGLRTNSCSAEGPETILLRNGHIDGSLVDKVISQDESIVESRVMRSRVAWLQRDVLRI